MHFNTKATYHFAKDGVSTNYFYNETTNAQLTNYL